MSVSRACSRCKTAKVKCDLVRPICGRCAQQGLICSGFPLDDVFVFRDENEVAQRNSERARRRQRQSPVAAASGPSRTVLRKKQSPESVDTVDRFLQQHYLWLNQRAVAEIPEPLKRDLETRAVERFFVNWTVHASYNGASPGHMDHLPSLYISAQPDSVLWHAVRAIAFADMRNEKVDNTAFSTKARQQYGAALTRVREMIHDQEYLGNDLVLSAMLLIDNFELMYLARNDPLGPHSQAMKYVLRRRGDGQLYSPTGFSLWRLGHFRLQTWQTLFREEPDAEQIAWMKKLNIERPDLRICSDVLHMNILSATARALTQATDVTNANRTEKLNRAMDLVQEMRDLNTNIEKWASEVAGVWKGTSSDPQNIAQPQDVNESPNLPIPHFPYPRLLKYDDAWLAYIWNFYTASQIVLRESLVEVLEYAATLQNLDEVDEDTRVLIQNQHDWVDTLSSAIIGSFPMLLGFTQGHNPIGHVRLPRQGKMAGRLFALFSMWVIQRSQFTSAQHKQTASEVVAWINSRHGLG